MKITREDTFIPIHITIENQQELLASEAAVSDYVVELEEEFEGDVDTPDFQSMKKLQKFLENYIFQTIKKSKKTKENS